MSTFKKCFPIAVLAFLFYLATLYWKSFVHLTASLLNAASPLLLGLVIAYVVNIIMIRYEAIYKKIFKDRFASSRRAICILLSYLTVVLLIVLIISIIAPQIVNAIQTFFKHGYTTLVPYLKRLSKNTELAKYTSSVESVLKNFRSSNTSKVQSTLTTMLTGASGAMKTITSVASSFASSLATLVFGLIFSLYLLGGKEKLQRQLKRVITTYLPKIADPLYHVAHVFDHAFSSFVVAKVTDGLILGILTTLGCLILQFPYATMIGVIIGVTALIPIIGAYIGAIISAFLILTVKPIQAIYFLIFYIILQQVDDNLIYPRIIGSSLGLPAIWSLGAVTVFGGTFGFIGMLIGVPVTSAIYTLLKEDMDRRNKKGEEMS